MAIRFLLVKTLLVLHKELNIRFFEETTLRKLTHTSHVEITIEEPIALYLAATYLHLIQRVQQKHERGAEGNV